MTLPNLSHELEKSEPRNETRLLFKKKKKRAIGTLLDLRERTADDYSDDKEKNSSVWTASNAARGSKERREKGGKSSHSRRRRSLDDIGK